MIRYYCQNCDLYFRGGAEDKECPLCKGKLTYVGECK